MRLPVTPLEIHGPVAQRQRQHPYKVTIGGSSPSRTTLAQVRQLGRAARLKPECLRVRLPLWAQRLGRQPADHLGLEPGMLWVRLPPEPLNERSMASWSSLECSPACHAGDRGFKSRRGRFGRHGAVRKSAKRPSSNLGDCGFDSRLRHLKTCVGWASASPTACKAAAKGCAGSTPARRTDNMARSSIGIGCQPLTLARRVRFPHGLLN